MPTLLHIGETVTFNAQFLIYDDSTDTESPIEPDLVVGHIYQFNSTTSTYEAYSDFTPTESVPGYFEYQWTPIEEGKFQIDFVATFGLQEVLNSRFIFVGTISTTDTLDANSTSYYLGLLDPLYLDPDIVLKYFTDGDLIEVTELIHWYSSELEYLINDTDLTEDEITPLMQNYILASVLCDLSRIYTFSGGMSGFTSSDTFTLGDLMVKSGAGTSSGGTGRNSIPTTWCELAAMLKDELIVGSAGMKAIVKGSNFCNPIPCRSLRRAD